MAKNKTRLELTWIGKENRPNLEPRILVEDREKSYHASQRVTDNDLFDNQLIFSNEVGPNRSLLICCGAYKADITKFENLTVKKIPKQVLKKCEWGHDDYSLEIKNLPVRPEQICSDDANGGKEEVRQSLRRFGKGKAQDQGPTLFDMGALE